MTIMTLQNNSVTTLNDLQAEIKLVKKRVRTREIDLEERFQRLPEESLKATMGAVLPAFINNKIAGGTWQLLRGVAGLFFGQDKANDKQSSWKDVFLSPAKQLGIFTLLKLAISWLKK